MGLMKIDLYAGNNTYLATIANDIDPLALSTIVYIPQIIPKNYHLCTLRFITANPPQVIYTADFNIIPSPYLEDPPTSTTTTTSSSSLLPTTDSTILSRISSTQPALPNPSDKPSSKSTSSSLTWSLGGRGKLVDVERVKFRLLFIVWPALVGLSLAM
ncbi:unnamed protein product [Cyclocybe aegerita]|uniref:Uncharacterized protein n=1 Tax=Cyclocybe aegerita TaxID=1973307 RepID=A0A8S0WT32_CYCAE|nr:unnamed protein product [Cyclocybe aegerita]